MNQSPSITPDQTLAALATTLPGASRVFARHRMDFCCHGQVTLADACRKKGLAVDSLTAELQAEEQRGDAPAEAWLERPLPVLIDHIVTHYHDAHREELPRLRAMAERVEKVHGEKASCPIGLAAVLAQLESELVLHMEKEERVLFPLIVSGAGDRAAGPIHVMELEHEDAAVLLEKIRGLTDDHVPPPEACGTWRALFLGLAEFEHELMQHVHLENHVLFPRALRGVA